MIIDLGHPLTQQPLIAEAVFLQEPFLLQAPIPRPVLR